MKKSTYRFLKHIEGLAILVIAVGVFGFLSAWERPNNPEAFGPNKDRNRGAAPLRTAAILPTQKVKFYDSDSTKSK